MGMPRGALPTRDDLRVRLDRDRRQGHVHAADRRAKHVLQWLLGKSRPGISYNRHFDVEGAIVFHRARPVRFPEQRARGTWMLSGSDPNHERALT
jgi:hypothetical protein